MLQMSDMNVWGAVLVGVLVLAACAGCIRSRASPMRNLNPCSSIASWAS